MNQKARTSMVPNKALVGFFRTGHGSVRFDFRLVTRNIFQSNWFLQVKKPNQSVPTGSVSIQFRFFVGSVLVNFLLQMVWFFFLFFGFEPVLGLLGLKESAPPPKTKIAQKLQKQSAQIT